MYCRSIIFTETKAFRYRDVFQLVPIFYSLNAPISVYTRHFPAFLEYQTDNVEEALVYEDEYRKKGIPEAALELGRKIPHQTRIRKEILHLLSALTNFHFFEYDFGYN